MDVSCRSHLDCIPSQFPSYFSFLSSHSILIRTLSSLSPWYPILTVCKKNVLHTNLLEMVEIELMKCFVGFYPALYRFDPCPNFISNETDCEHACIVKRPDEGNDLWNVLWNYTLSRFGSNWNPLNLPYYRKWGTQKNEPTCH